MAREEWAQPRGRKSRRRHCGKAIEAQLSRLSADVARLRADTTPAEGGRELHDIAARSATQALAIAQGLMLPVSESSRFV